MPQVDILIKTDGTTATSAELNGGAGNGGISPQSVEPITPDGTASNGNGSTLVKSVFAQRLAQAGIAAAKSTINYYKSNYGNFTGDYLGQQKIDNMFSVVSDLVTLGTSMVSGAAAGSAFGPVGAVAGLVVGAVVGGINLGTSYYQATTSQALQVNKINIQANYNSCRIGSVLINGSR